MENFSLGAAALLASMAGFIRALGELQLVWGFVVGFAIGMVVHAFLGSGGNTSTVLPVSNKQSPEGAQQVSRARATRDLVYITLACSITAFIVLVVFSTLRF